jgi:hypothetical protein
MSGLMAWVEFGLLRDTLRRRIGSASMPVALLAKLWMAAAIAAAAGYGLKLLLGTARPLVVGFLALGLYGVLYMLLAMAFGVPHARRLAARVLGRAAGKDGSR